MKLNIWCAVCWLLLLDFSGCGFGGNFRPLKELSVPSSEQSYMIKAGDTLNVDVWGEPRLSGEALVRTDGKFTMALVNEVQAEGKTTEAVSKEVSTRLSEFIPEASVTVSIALPAPIRYYLTGTFVKPGEYRSDSRITLLQAIATGGGFAPFANDSSLLLIRKSPTGDIRYQLNYSSVIAGKEPNPELKDGDTLAVE